MRCVEFSARTKDPQVVKIIRCPPQWCTSKPRCSFSQLNPTICQSYFNQKHDTEWLPIIVWGNFGLGRTCATNAHAHLVKKCMLSTSVKVNIFKKTWVPQCMHVSTCCTVVYINDINGTVAQEFVWNTLRQLLATRIIHNWLMSCATRLVITWCRWIEIYHLSLINNLGITFDHPRLHVSW